MTRRFYLYSSLPSLGWQSDLPRFVHDLWCAVRSKATSHAQHAGGIMTSQVQQRAGKQARAASEKDTKLAQKLDQFQPFIAVFLQECILGQLAYFGPT